MQKLEYLNLVSKHHTHSLKHKIHHKSSVTNPNQKRTHTFVQMIKKNPKLSHTTRLSCSCSFRCVLWILFPNQTNTLATDWWLNLFLIPNTRLIWLFRILGNAPPATKTSFICSQSSTTIGRRESEPGAYPRFIGIAKFTKQFDRFAG